LTTGTGLPAGSIPITGFCATPEQEGRPSKMTIRRMEIMHSFFFIKTLSMIDEQNFTYSNYSLVKKMPSPKSGTKNP
jgi:hypothetical protein